LIEHGRTYNSYVGQEPVLFTGSVAENVAKGRTSAGEKPLLSMEEAMHQSDSKRNEESNCFHSGFLSRITYATDNMSFSDIEMGLKSIPQEDNSEFVVDDDIIESCKASHAHDFVSKFPQLYQTEVGEGSIMVSGGQKQRIAIARALVKHPAVLLLDEATSALDAESERIVQESIDQLQQLKQQTTIVIAHRLSTIRNADKIIVVDKGMVVETGTHDELLFADGLYSQLWAKQSGK
jgi:ABC-type multidrug transport system fused ATPase/permease subunit